MKIRGTMLWIVITFMISPFIEHSVTAAKPKSDVNNPSVTCSANYCKNGGSCEGKGTCRCVPGWSGPTCDVMDTSSVYGDGSGTVCVKDYCKNDGICDADNICQCSPGWGGPTCEVDTGRKLIATYVISGKQYTVNAIKMTFTDAMKECERTKGRIIDALTPSTTRDLHKVLQHTEGVLSRRDQTDVKEGFWVNAGRSQDQLANATKKQCNLANSRMNYTKVSCKNTKLPVICVKPTSGPCYPEVAEKSCPFRCQYNRTALTCECLSGFKKIGEKCVDVDECKKWGSCMSPMTCENLIGSYRCVCEEGMQGNGADVCGYVLTMEQKNVNLNYVTSTMLPKTTHLPVMDTKPAYLMSSNLEKTRKTLEEKFMKIFKIVTESVTKVIIKTISNKTENASIVLDVYTEYSDVTPTSLIEFYKEVERRGKVFYLEGSFMIPASLVCYPSVLFIGSKSFTFRSALPEQTVWSKERCPDGRTRVSVQCKVKKNGDDTETAYYDIRSIKEASCSGSVDTILNKLSHIKSIKTAESTMADLDSLTSDLKNTNQDIIWKAVDSMNTLGNFVWSTESDISVETMQSMVNIANNINRAQKNDKLVNQQSSLLNQAQRHQIVSALEMCSTHVLLQPSETVHVNSEAVNIQVTNVLSAKEGASFANDVKTPNAELKLRQNSCRKKGAKVQSYIPQEILNEAALKKQETTDLKNLAVSFVYYSDTEFFESDTDIYDVEQVLSIKISSVNIRDLKTPFWFQIPSRTEKNAKGKRQKRYYKCAYLDKETGKWLTDGCTSIPGSNPPNCTCNHMTNFAILVQTHPQMNDYSLKVVGKVCCIVSIVAISLMLLTYLYFPSLRKSQVVKIHSHLGICLLISYALLLTVTERPKPHGHCVASAATLQFFLLSSWGWMVVECVTMYRKLVSVITTQIYHYVTIAAVGVYLSAASIVAVTVILSVAWYDTSNYSGWITTGSDFFPSSYVSDRMCWLHSYSLIFGFLIPIGIAFAVNLIGAFIILKAITWGRKEVGESSAKHIDAKTYIIRAITLSVLLGMSWLFSIPLTLSDDATVNSIFGWLFSISNGLQGVFMFVLFCLRRQDIRELITNEVMASFGKSEHSTDSQEKVTRNHEESTALATYHNAYRNSVRISEIVSENSEEEKESPLQVHLRNTQNDDRFLQIGKISTFHPTES